MEGEAAGFNAEDAQDAERAIKKEFPHLEALSLFGSDWARSGFWLGQADGWRAVSVPRVSPGK